LSDDAGPGALAGVRVLVVGASSGIGRAVAVEAAARGARVAVAARRLDLLTELAESVGAAAYQLDVADPAAVARVVPAAADALGGLDVLFVSSAVMPVARVAQTDAQTWARVLAVNALGPALLLSAALPVLSPGGLAMVASSDGVGRPRAGLAAYSASKAALDEILTSWRVEHPQLPVIRLVVGPTTDTDILQDADPDVLTDLVGTWVRAGHLPDATSSPQDVAATALGVVAAVRRAPSVFPEVVRLAPRATAGTP
jgi:NAD(P)-dependent dehydrogenase (short-subunit alcohol dehydrogenase family)